MQYLVAVKNGDERELRLVSGIKSLFETVVQSGLSCGEIQRVFVRPDGGIVADTMFILPPYVDSLMLVNAYGTVVDFYSKTEGELEA